MKEIAKPTLEQIKWADCEVGVIIHMDLQQFEPSFRFRKNWGYTPSASIFNPKELNTDQWIVLKHPDFRQTQAGVPGDS